MEGPAFTGEHTIFVTLPKDDLRAFAQSDPKSVEVWMGDQILTRLDFDGFGPAWNSMTTCIERAAIANSHGK